MWVWQTSWNGKLHMSDESPWSNRMCACRERGREEANQDHTNTHTPNVKETWSPTLWLIYLLDNTLPPPWERILSIFLPSWGPQICCNAEYIPVKQEPTPGRPRQAHYLSIAIGNVLAGLFDVHFASLIKFWFQADILSLQDKPHIQTHYWGPEAIIWARKG